MIALWAEFAAYRMPERATDRTPRVCMFSNRDANMNLVPERPMASLVGTTLAALGCQEVVASRWNLDNVIIQSIVLAKYLPSLASKRIGLRQFLREADRTSIALHLGKLFPCGCVLQDVFGAADAASCTKSHIDAAELMHRRTTDLLASSSEDPQTERFFLSPKRHIVSEYRVHTLQRSVIQTLIMKKDGHRLPLNDPDRTELERVVGQALNELPDALCSGLSEWHLSVDDNLRMELDWIDFCGVKPAGSMDCELRYSTELDEPLNVAHLLRFVSIAHGLSIQFNIESGETAAEQELGEIIYRVKCWNSLLDAIDGIFGLFKETWARSRPSQASMREMIFGNTATSSDRQYMGYINFLMRTTNDLR